MLIFVGFVLFLLVFMLTSPQKMTKQSENKIKYKHNKCVDYGIIIEQTIILRDIEYMKNNTKKLVLSGMFMGIGLVLPFITGQIPEIGKMLCPMHIPIMLCGIFCGWQYGLIVGFITPLLRSILFGMPVMIPGGVSMAFELATYACIIAIVYRLLPKKTWAIYIALISSMIAGRIVWGLVRMTIGGITGNSFTYSAFISGALLTALPGIISQLIIIPLIVVACKKQINSLETE